MYVANQLLGARESQEDSLLVLDSVSSVYPAHSETSLYLVADGMGGHIGGRLASQLCVDSFRKSVERQSASESIELLPALHDANARLREEIRSEPKLRGMGTTLAAVLLSGTTINWISVGDSPLFVFRNGKMRRLNADHSMLPLLLEESQKNGLDESHARKHARRHHLRSTVSGQEMKLIDKGAFTVLASDIFILASDGIETLPADFIAEILEGHANCQLDTISEILASEINKAKAVDQDNASYILFKS
jgi:serine/threonine protein phosphatase PrpC